MAKMMKKMAAVIAMAAVAAFADPIPGGDGGVEPVKEYSQRRMIEVLHERGYYFQLRDFLQNTAGGVYWDLFLASQVLKSDDRFFMELVPMIQQALGVSGDLVGEILAECEIVE